MKEQEVVLGRITDIGEANDYIVVTNYSYGNTGVVRFLGENLDPRYTISFSFQTRYYSIRMMDAGGDRGDNVLFDKSTAGGHTKTSDILRMIADNVVKA